MYLKYLSIKDHNNNLVRHVDFKKGANIIKGVSSTDDEQGMTNSLGKTTLLRCIDFCLFGKWNSFIFDKELKENKNNTVFDFFKKALPSFELLIVKDIDSQISSNLKIKRQLTVNLKAKSDKSFFTVNNFLNDKQVTDQEFNDTVKKFLFNFEGTKPTLRQLSPKFIRTSDHQISNIIKYLHPSTPAFEYEILHLFLFDFTNMQLIHDRIKKEHDIAGKTQELKSLENLMSTGKREINDVKKIELAELQSKYDSFQISKEYERENDELNLLQERININKASITSLYLDKDVWQKRLLDTSSKMNAVNVEIIDYIYKEAEIYNINIQKKFEETIKFHEQMLENEIDFINKAIQKNDANMKALEEEHIHLASHYSELLNKLGSSGSLAEYTKLGNQINQLTKEIAETESIINQHEKTQKELSSYKLEFEGLTIEITKLLDSLRRKITIFNRYFSEYSKTLTDDSYYLAISQDRNNHFNLVPSCEKNDSHVGDGRKQSVIVAFDLAYVSFSYDPAIGLTRPHFFTQDKIEIIDINILEKLINLTNDIDCQFIFPIIADKLNNISEFDEDNIILTLSEDNKFFNIEGYIEESTKNDIKHLNNNYLIEDVA